MLVAGELGRSTNEQRLLAECAEAAAERYTAAAAATAAACESLQGGRALQDEAEAAAALSAVEALERQVGKV